MLKATSQNIEKKKKNVLANFGQQINKSGKSRGSILLCNFVMCGITKGNDDRLSPPRAED